MVPLWNGGQEAVFVFTEKGNEGAFWGDGTILCLYLDCRYTLYTHVKIYMCQNFTHQAIPSPCSGKTRRFFFLFGEYEAEDLWTQGHQAHRREVSTKNWGIK